VSARISIWIGLALVLATAACGGNDSTPTAPSTTTSFAWSSALIPGGAASHVFLAGKSGTITVTLTSIGPPSMAVGVGLGIPNPGGTGCNLTTAVNTGPGSSPQVSASVEAGSYCVRIYDLGTLTTPLGFFITIVYPT
jgi:hypothetical protein